MFTSSGPGKSVDDLPALSPRGRTEFVWHSTNRPGLPSSRRGSVASSIRSVGGTLDNSSAGWGSTVTESGQNAISTLLQPPIIRTGLQTNSNAPLLKPPTARDIPPVTLTNIPHVEDDEFSPYISQFGALYEQLRRIRESEAEATSNRRGSKQDEPADNSADGYLRPGTRPSIGRKGSNTSLSSLNSPDPPSPARRMSSFRGKSAQGPTPLSTIPTVYFDDDFHLENPRTFDVVSERSEVIPTEKTETNGAPAPRKALATNAILQEKLSWYMDTIEIHLINSISTASTTFFTALGSLKELHSEAAESVKRIKTLRTELQALDDEVVTQGLEIVQARKRQDNLRQLQDAVTQLKRIIDAVASCEDLVDAGEVDKALEGIDSLESLISGERKAGSDSSVRFQDLSQASALRGVNADMNTLRLRIGKAYETQFIDVLLGDLKRHVESVSQSEVLMRWSNSASRARGAAHARSPSVFPSYLSSTDELKARLFPAMLGLHRAHYLPNAVASCREAILREVRNLIRRPLPSSNDDDNESMMSASTAGGGRHMSSQEKSTVLARNLRALDPEDAEELLMKIYVGVAETLRRLTTQNKVMLDVASSVTESLIKDMPSVKSPPTSPRPDRHPGNPAAVAATVELQTEIHNALDVTNLLGQAVDVANDKITKILKVRSEQAQTLPLDFFLRYFTLNLFFSTECEAISGRSGISLKNVVNGHIKEFVQKTRDSEMQKLAQGMELDQWASRDFTGQNTELLKRILESSTQDSAAWTERTRLWIPYRDMETSNGTAPAEPETNGSARERVNKAVIDSEEFLLPHSAILCLDGIGTFLHLVTGIPSMTTDIATSLISYLQLFNSRCTQLILGAGATRSAGLRNITSKHLTLAAQALSFVATLMPHVREFVRKYAGSGAGVSGLMAEFDKVRRLLQEHQSNIHQKLVDIMTGRVTIHARSLRAIDWPAKQGEGANPYMETLTKETNTLYKVLTRHLPKMSSTMIMKPVFESYEEQLGKALEEADPKNSTGYRNMEFDVQYFISKLSAIDGFGRVGDKLMAIVMSKEIKSPEVKSPEAKSPEVKSSEVKSPKTWAEPPKANGDDVSKTEEAKEEAKEEIKEEAKEGPKEETKEETKEEVKAEVKDEVKEAEEAAEEKKEDSSKESSSEEATEPKSEA